MANAIYPLFKQALMNGSANTDMSAGTVVAALIDTGVYTYSAAHQFESDLSGVIGTNQTLTTKVFGADGSFDSDNPTWTAVAGGTTVEAIVLFLDTTVPTTSRLILYVDAGQTGLPFTTNGGDVTYTVDAGGWFIL